MAVWLRAAEQFLNKIDRSAATSLRNSDKQKLGTSDSEYSDHDLSDSGVNEFVSSGVRSPSFQEVSGSNSYPKQNTSNYSSSPIAPMRTYSSGSSNLRPSEQKGNARSASSSTLQTPYDSDASEADDWTELLRHGDSSAVSAPSGGSSANSGSRISAGGQSEGLNIRTPSKDKKSRSSVLETGRPRQIFSAAVPVKNEPVVASLSDLQQTRRKESAPLEARTVGKKVVGERKSQKVGSNSVVEKGAADVLAAARNFRSDKEKSLKKVSQQVLPSTALVKETETLRPLETVGDSTVISKSSTTDSETVSAPVLVSHSVKQDPLISIGQTSLSMDSDSVTSVPESMSGESEKPLLKGHQSSSLLSPPNTTPLTKGSVVSKSNTLENVMDIGVPLGVPDIDVVEVDLSVKLSKDKAEILEEQNQSLPSEGSLETSSFTHSSSTGKIGLLSQTFTQNSTRGSDPAFSMISDSFSRPTIHPQIHKSVSSPRIDAGESEYVSHSLDKSIPLKGGLRRGSFPHQHSKGMGSSSLASTGGETNLRSLRDKEKSVGDLLLFLRNEKELDVGKSVSSYVKSGEILGQNLQKDKVSGLDQQEGETREASHSSNATPDVQGTSKASVDVVVEDRGGNDEGNSGRDNKFPVENDMNVRVHHGETKDGELGIEGRKHLKAGEQCEELGTRDQHEESQEREQHTELGEGEEHKGSEEREQNEELQVESIQLERVEKAGLTVNDADVIHTDVPENLTDNDSSIFPERDSKWKGEGTAGEVGPLEVAVESQRREELLNQATSSNKTSSGKNESGRTEDLIEAYLEQVMLKSGKGEGEESNLPGLTNGEAPRVSKLPLPLPPRSKPISRRASEKRASEKIAAQSEDGMLKSKGLGRGVGKVGKAGKEVLNLRLRREYGKNGGNIEEDSSDESSDSGSESESEGEEDLKEALQAEQREAALKAEVERNAILAREISALATVKEALKEREGIASKLALEKETVQRATAEASEKHAKEIAKLRASMMDGMTAVDVEKNAHSSTRMELQDREAELEEDNISQASALVASQRALDEEVNRVAAAKGVFESLERSKAQLERDFENLRKQREAGDNVHGGFWASNHIGVGTESRIESRISVAEEVSGLSSRIDERQQQVRELEEKFEKVQLSQREPSEVELELDLRLKNLINLLIQKQSQVESLASEKATFTLRLETVSSSLADERAASLRSVKRKVSLNNSADWPGLPGEDDVEFGLSRSYTLIRSKRLLMGDMDYGYGGRANAVVGHLANFAWSLDSWVLGGASYIRTNSLARAMVWGYLILLHFWVLFVWFMHGTHL